MIACHHHLHRLKGHRRFAFGGVLLGLVAAQVFSVSLRAQSVAPNSYSAYSGTDVKTQPPAPVLGAANSIFTDPTFGSRILRVTDQNTASGQSFIPGDAG